jgi:hypothetical protein
MILLRSFYEKSSDDCHGGKLPNRSAAGPGDSVMPVTEQLAHVPERRQWG